VTPKTRYPESPVKQGIEPRKMGSFPCCPDIVPKNRVSMKHWHARGRELCHGKGLV